MNVGKVGAILFRTSTSDQLEISPDTQVKEPSALADQTGYSIPSDYVIGCDWASESFWDSPTMERLKELVRSGDISGIFQYDADRGPSKPVHRLLYRALCEEYGVRVFCCHGEIPAGEMGEVMEFLSAWSKEKQVHSAQRGARDGLRDRARLKGLPVTGQPPYGYQFRYEHQAGKRIPMALVPDPNTYIVACRIWRLALEGQSMKSICRAMEVPTVKGNANWHASTIQKILRNPVYAGIYHALRRQAKTPETRRKPGKTYGKSSSQPVPREAWCPLPDFQVVDPIISWEEWETVQQQLVRNQQESIRNGKRFYLLRAMVACPHHPRHLTGHASGERYWYECPVRGGHDIGVARIPCPRLKGPDTEAKVWQKVVEFLSEPELFLTELESRRQSSAGEQSEGRNKIAAEERKLAEVIRQESELVNLRLQELVSQEALEQSAALLRARRTYHLEEIARQKEVLATSEQAQAAVESLAALRDRIADRLDSATPEDRRRVLEALDTRITVTETGGLDISIGVPGRVDCVHQTQRGETRHSNDINVTDVSSWGSVTVAAMNRHRRQTSTRR